MKVLASIAMAVSSLVAANSMAAEKPAVVLVHGAFEDVHVWDGVAAKLKADGYRVLPVNLPGRSSTPMAADKVSLDVYRDAVLAAMASESQPVVLVGHSFAGITISAVAEAAPEKVKTLVYVAAYLPKDGESLLSLAKQDKDSKIGGHLNLMKDQGIASVAYAARADLFVNDGSAGLRKALPDLVLDEPLAPLAMPVKLSAARYGRTDKTYVHTAQDQVVSPYLQNLMTAATPVRLTFKLNTGHLPLLTDSAGLVAAISKSAE